MHIVRALLNYISNVSHRVPNGFATAFMIGVKEHI